MKTKILGIETSCDDTAAAVVADGREILANVISSQNAFHKKYGGVVPEIASRKHLELICYVVQEAMDQSKVSIPEVDAVAVTTKPGLVGSLLIGVSFAKALAFCYDLPLIGINHIEAHIYSNFIEHPEIDFPHICLTVSGGHTLLVYVQEKWRVELLGGTQDDAAGEAYDKVAQYLNLGFPGGPIIDRLAQNGDERRIEFPKPLWKSGDYNFSFSGLKTAVRYFVSKSLQNKDLPPIEDIVASFQRAAVEVLVEKAISAALGKRVSTITLTGGVAANSKLRQVMIERAKEYEIKVYYPSPILCTDNAAMIAGLAYHKFIAGQRDGLDLNASAGGELLKF